MGRFDWEVEAATTSTRLVPPLQINSNSNCVKFDDDEGAKAFSLLSLWFLVLLLVFENGEVFIDGEVN